MTDLFMQGFKGIEAPPNPSIQAKKKDTEDTVAPHNNSAIAPDEPVEIHDYSSPEPIDLSGGDPDSTYTIILEKGGDAFQAYMVVHEVLELDVKTCQDLVERAPGVLLNGVQRDRATKICSLFYERGIPVRVEQANG